MQKNVVLVIDRNDLKNALADFFARVLEDVEQTRQKLLDGKLHTDIPDLTAESDEELIQHYCEFDLGFALLSKNSEVDTVLIDLGGNTWDVAAKREALGQS